MLLGAQCSYRITCIQTYASCTLKIDVLPEFTSKMHKKRHTVLVLHHPILSPLACMTHTHAHTHTHTHRLSIAKPTLSATHTLGGAPSNPSQLYAHYTLDGGQHWRSVPFCDARTLQGTRVVAAELDCDPMDASSRQGKSRQRSSNSRPNATFPSPVPNAPTSSYKGGPPPQTALQPSSTGMASDGLLQVVVSTSPCSPVQGSGM